MFTFIRNWLNKPSKFDLLMQAQRASTEKMVSEVVEMAKAQSNATAELALAASKYLDLFKVNEPPKVRVTRDEDEYRAEMDRKLAAKGYPVNKSFEEQLAFLMRQDENL